MTSHTDQIKLLREAFRKVMDAAQNGLDQRGLAALDALETIWDTSKQALAATSQPAGEMDEAECRRDIRSIVRDTMAQHWLMAIHCDHDAKTDRAQCSCSLWRGDAMPTVGAAVNNYFDHFWQAVEAARTIPAPAPADVEVKDGN